MNEADRPISAWSSFGKGPRVGLFIVVLIAAATRLIGLGGLDVWNDEVYSHDASSDLVPKLLKWETVSNESSSPWPFLEMKAARQVFGESSPLTLRVPSALHGIAAVALLYLVTGLIVSWPVALASALMLALNPFALEWSREGRMYTQWLSATLLLTGVVYHAVKDVRERGGAWHSWRWWLTGALFMAVHAMNVMGTMTIAGVALWLGLMALLEFFSNRSAAVRIILGSALAGAVYLGSWGLTGIAKILMLMGGAKPAGTFVPEPLGGQITAFFTALPGHVPLVVAACIWLAAMVGLVLIAREGHGRFALLLAIVSLAPWLAYFSITKSHFWTPRYAFTGLLVLTAGLGALIASLWEGRLIGHRGAGRVAAVVLAALPIAAAAPYLHEVYFVPKMEVRKAIAPIQQHGAEGEVIMLFPDYYASFNQYPPYQFGKVTVIRGPKGTWLDAGDGFKDTFDNLYSPAASTDANTPPKPTPPAAWLFLLQWEGPGDVKANWIKRFAQIKPVLAAYGLTAADVDPHVDATTHTLTLRLSRDENDKGRIDHVVATRTRRYR